MGRKLRSDRRKKQRELGELDLVLWTLENTKHFDFKKQTFTKH